ncbi:MAG: potassium channel family protein, partial [Pseudomonadales bacterium]
RAVTLRTARQAFKYSLLFTSGQGVLLLSNEPLVADYEHLAALSARPAVRNVLSGFEGKTLFALLGSQVLDQDGIDRFLADMETAGGSGALVSRDLYPYLEYATPRNNALTEQDKRVFQQHLASYVVTGPTPVVNMPDEAAEAFTRAAYYYGRSLTKFFAAGRDDNIAAFRFSAIFGFLFFAHVSFLVTKELLFEADEVSEGTLWAAVNVYLTIGIAFAFLYTTLGLFDSDAFQGKFVDDALSEQLVGYVYFSFITLSTLGYGDITPGNTLTGTFTYLEAILGQLYLAIMMARLVGLYIANRQS